MTFEQMVSLFYPSDSTRTLEDRIYQAVEYIKDRDTIKRMKDQEYIKAYEDLKRRNDEYPTAKRTKALQDMEERMRAQGLLQ